MTEYLILSGYILLVVFLGAFCAALAGAAWLGLRMLRQAARYRADIARAQKAIARGARITDRKAHLP